MQFLVTVGDSRESAMDQAKLIIGDDAQIVDEGHADGADYLQYNSKSPVSAPSNAFRAGIPDKKVFVYWVCYS